MSVDTRTPRTPTGGAPGGFFDDEPILSSVKVPSDPAQVIVNNASFRVKLATPTPHSRALADTARVPVVPARSLVPLAGAVPLARRGGAAGAGVAGASGVAARRRTPVVWSGRSAPGDVAATSLLDAVRPRGLTVPARSAESAAATTQVLPRVIPGRAGPPTVVGPRAPEPDGHGPGAPVRPAGRPDDARDEPFEPYGDGPRGHGHPERDEAAERARHAYYPGRRMNLGVVLLPLRVFLGFISVYAGMGKLTDPVYFDGGERGSMVAWLGSLEPWAIAAPLHGFALAHPVAAGLTVAFLQVTVGVLTVCGLWQRAAASLGALLSAALLVTVSWHTVAAYDTPDIIYLAAWSPLLIAGAPVYSLDARLAGEAWRRLGPRAPLGELRRRVLRRGAVMAALVAGLTLLVGSLLGSAVRSAQIATVPEPGEPLRNHLPGSPLPQDPARPSQRATAGPTAGATAGTGATAGPTPSPSASATSGQSTGTGGGPATGAPGGEQTVQAPEPPAVPEPPAPPPPAPQPSVGGTTGGSTGGEQDGSTGGTGDTGTEPESGATGDTDTGRNPLGGLLG
ncbi:hypothetical protein V1J52_16175 [Streptomyces sp. TRM 70351]|uniref:DoxX family protein n=1 Tax=Streptomyces sp. TRM 70351 TaxID=3116552 RepID=UPI002E7C46C7|nr:hypothetical protein [Streptomyces sp. TRM 70351]MEE1929704.1 hypothetical protein [Streptomyces sp. TRM 70351]